MIAVPPGASTREISANSAVGSGMWCMTRTIVMQVERRVLELEVVGLRLHLLDVGALEHLLGRLELRPARLGQRHVVGELAQQEAQASEAAADVGGAREVRPFSSRRIAACSAACS